MAKKHFATPPISNFYSRKEWENACWERISESKDLLQLLVTSHERHDFVMRAAAIDCIVSGKSYRQIGRELWLSPQTVSGLKKAISEKTYKSYLERSKKERRKKTYSPRIEISKPRRRGKPHRTKYGTLYIP